ncbi:hypothetical protein HELRODRAFT_172961 [Helobdella robusta]|uniref:C2H2-type domain-containing protein n=1 Tax=Helobdella robusta TaxID=6412 RepID=T1F677_HELRO|nr:hypothetical protein HELRODRAFT_172961 [Helobdella robusta]ESO03931.1 hypothetical protein HELRODRAFT_172961 [Helobdella robusta]
MLVRNSGLWNDEMKATAKELEAGQKTLEKRLKRLASDQIKKKKSRVEFKQKIEELSQIIQRLRKNDKRRTEKLQACKTLDELHEALLEHEYRISRSATYLRLLPRNSTSIEGRRHITTVPVKLLKATNSERHRHDDARFAAATDDKARVPLGLPAANKQSSILMHLDYRIQLPDHDWVVAKRHKLIPSVYAVCVVKKDHVSYSGPTAILIRSGKHDSSTAATHAYNFQTLRGISQFEEVMCSGNAVKPVVIITIDGGPDENPRYPKTLAAAYHAFRKNDLDAIFIACHAPGHSAYNAVERRMAPLLRELFGLILPHDHFGSHLDASLKTTNAELEMANFQKAGEVLAEVWNATVIDGFDVVATFVPCSTGKLDLQAPPNDWFASHVRQSQYCLHIIKCNTEACCGLKRSHFNEIFPHRFLPPPIPYIITKTGIACSQKQTCFLCHLYFPSQGAMKTHSRNHKDKGQPPVQQDQDDTPHVEQDPDEGYSGEILCSEAVSPPVRMDQPFPVVRNLFEWLQSAFVDIE